MAPNGLIIRWSLVRVQPAPLAKVVLRVMPNTSSSNYGGESWLKW